MASSARIPPDGVYVPVPTFFKPATKDTVQPAVDVGTQVQHSIYLAKSGIHGLVLLGSTGEAIHLSRQERHDLIAGVRKGLDDAGFKDYPIMAGVLINSVDEALEWLEDSKKAGAQWGLVLAPGYFGAAANQENIVEWFTVVADRSPLPILLYNYPGVTNNIMIGLDSYAKLAQHPNIVGCKMSHGNVSHHVQIANHPSISPSKFRVFSGFGQQLGPIVLFNAAGVIDGMSAYFPKTVVRLFKLATQRPVTDEALKEMQDLQYRVSAAEEFIGKTGVIGIRDAIKKYAGFGTTEGGRLPLRGSLKEEEWKNWETVFKRMQEVEEKL